MSDPGRNNSSPRANIAIIDPDAGSRRALRQGLERAGHAVVEHESAPDSAAFSAELDAVLLAVGMRSEEVHEVLQRVTAIDPELPVVVITGDRTPANTVRALRGEAWELLSRPLVEEQVAAAVRRAVERRRLGQQNRSLQLEVVEQRGRSTLLGQSAAMRVLMQRLDSVLDSNAPLGLVGEPGSGKRTLARALHSMGVRRNGPLVEMNCATTQPSEVQGVEEPSGAIRKGWLERAHGGTLLLDQIADADPATQEALLQLVGRGIVRRVGGTRDVAVDVRIIVCTRQPLADEVRGRGFSDELCRRLEERTVRMPPLRERREDIPLLVAALMAQGRRDGGMRAERVSAQAMELLVRQPWRENLRELQTAVLRAMMAADGPEIRVEHLPPAVRSVPTQLPPYLEPVLSAPDPLDGDGVITLRELERREIMKALSHTGGSVAQAARKLGIGRATLYRRLAELNLPPPTVALRNALATRGTAKSS